MPTFQDKNGQSWLVEIHAPAMKKVRDLLKVDLWSLLDGNFSGLTKLLNDPCTLVDVLYVLCKAQADAAGITDEQFGMALVGDSYGTACDCFQEAYSDFFPSPALRAALTQMRAKEKAFRNKTLEMLTREIAGIDPDRMILTMARKNGLTENELGLLASKLNDISGKCQVSPDSTPGK